MSCEGRKQQFQQRVMTSVIQSIRQSDVCWMPGCRTLRARIVMSCEGRKQQVAQRVAQRVTIDVSRSIRRSDVSKN